MPTKLEISGTYSRQGANFYPKNTNSPFLVFATRKKITPNKPANYLLHKVDSKHFNYVSSVYEIRPNEYTFDYDHTKYLLTLKADEVIIIDATVQDAIVQDAIVQDAIVIDAIVEDATVEDAPIINAIVEDAKTVNF